MCQFVSGFVILPEAGGTFDAHRACAVVSVPCLGYNGPDGQCNREALQTQP